MKKRTEDDSLMNSFARKVGHAVGTIAKATQDMAGNAAAMVQPKKVRTKSVKVSRTRPTGKKKASASKSSTGKKSRPSTRAVRSPAKRKKRASPRTR
jgi:hypothetical protein